MVPVLRGEPNTTNNGHFTKRRKTSSVDESLEVETKTDVKCKQREQQELKINERRNLIYKGDGINSFKRHLKF